MRQHKETEAIETPFHEPAFPATSECDDGSKWTYLGLSRRQYYAAHAPFNLKDAYAALETDAQRGNAKILLAKLVALKFSYADAMIEAEKS